MASIGKSLKSFHNETLAIQLHGGSDGLDTTNSARVTGRPLPVLRGSPAAENMNGSTPLAGRANTNSMARDRDRDRNRDRDAPISLFATRSFNKKAGRGEMSGAASRLGTPARTSSSASSTAASTAPRPLSSRISSGSNGHSRTASKSPLDMRKAPTPPAKRQKTEKTAQTIDSQVRRGDNHERVLSRSWRTPEAVSLSQPMPGATASASATNDTGSNSDANSGLRTSKSFSGLAEIVEENRVVYVLDSDDEDSSTSHRASAQALSASSSKVACLPPLKRPFLPGTVQQKRWVGFFKCSIGRIPYAPCSTYC